MTTAVATTNDFSAIEKVLIQGDLSPLTPIQRTQYYNRVCETVGLNPLTKPFDYITLNGKLVLYANKGCAEQLRHVHKISIKIVKAEKIDDIYVVIAEATSPVRTDSSTGAVNIKGLGGEALANAMMKAETKAKRRVTLSICGLNMLDELEVDSIPGAKKSEAIQEKIAAARPVAVEAVPAPEKQLRDKYDGDDPLLDYVVPAVVRAFPGRKLREVPIEILEPYCVEVLNHYQKENKSPKGSWAEFLAKAGEYIATYKTPKETGKGEETSFANFEPGSSG